MTICTSGDKYCSYIAFDAYKYFCNHHSGDTFSNKEIEVHYCDLTEDNVFGWCERVDEDSWLVTIHNALGYEEHFRTLFHEFTHVVQDIFGIKDEEIRESQAYQIEGTMYREMCASLKSVL